MSERNKCIYQNFQTKYFDGRARTRWWAKSRNALGLSHSYILHWKTLNGERTLELIFGSTVCAKLIIISFCVCMQTLVRWDVDWKVNKWPKIAAMPLILQQVQTNDFIFSIILQTFEFADWDERRRESRTYSNRTSIVANYGANNRNSEEKTLAFSLFNIRMALVSVICVPLLFCCTYDSLRNDNIFCVFVLRLTQNAQMCRARRSVGWYFIKRKIEKNK